MRKITEKEIKDLAQEALRRGNPYLNNARAYPYGGQILYLYGERLYSEQELNDAYLETAMKDVKSGYGERGAGYYDKWYRYTRADGGRAYDLGVRLAADTPGCCQECQFIGCAS